MATKLKFCSVQDAISSSRAVVQAQPLRSASSAPVLSAKQTSMQSAAKVRSPPVRDLQVLITGSRMVRTADVEF